MRTYRIMTRDQASQLVRAYAEGIAAAVGVDVRDTERGVTALACENALGDYTQDGRFYVHGVWQMPLPAEEHATTLARLHDSWAAQGFQIKKYEMHADSRGVVIAVNPIDEAEVWVESTDPPVALAVVILSACYRPE